MTRARLTVAALLGALSLGSIAACQPAATSASAARSDGAVSIRVSLPRRIAAVTADVARVTVRLDCMNIVALTYERGLDRAALDAAQEAAFTNLPRASYNIVVTAYDADGLTIGQSKDLINVLGPGVDRKVVKLTLAPTYTEAPTSGDVDASLTFSDLPTVGTVLATYTTPFESPRIAADHAGAVWLGDEGRLVKLDANGQIIIDKTVQPLGLASIYDMHVDSQNNLWVAVPNCLKKFSSDGTLLATTINLGSVYQFTVDGHDHPWVAAYHGVRQLDTDGNIVGTYTQPGTPNSQGTNVAVDDEAGIVWVDNGTQPQDHGDLGVVARFSTDGTFLGESFLAKSSRRNEMAVHPDGHLWMYATEHPEDEWSQDFVRLAPDGTVTNRFIAGVFCGGFVFDRDGNTWLGRGSEFNNLYKLSADGTPIGVNTLKDGVGFLDLASDGTLLVVGDHKLYRVQP